MINTELDIDYSDLHWGKYDCPMAQYIDVNLTDIRDADDSWTNDMGDGWARFGRRVYSWNDQGFHSCDTYDTVDEAQEVVRQAWVRIEEQQDEACQEQGCKPCECGAYDCVAHGEGCTHVVGCERDWIG